MLIKNVTGGPFWTLNEKDTIWCNLNRGPGAYGLLGVGGAVSKDMCWEGLLAAGRGEDVHWMQEWKQRGICSIIVSAKGASDRKDKNERNIQRRGRWFKKRLHKIKISNI